MMKSVALMSTSSPEPLAGIRVVSLASNLPGPVAAAQLASMGAQVTKIEPQLEIRLLQWPELGTTSLWVIKRSLSWI